MRIQKMFKSYVLLVFYLVVCFIGMDRFSTASAADWPHWRGPDYNGISRETGWTTTWPESGPKILWEKSIGAGFSSMAVSDGRIYAMGNIDNRDILYCYDAATGNEIWKKSYPCPLLNQNHEGGPCATPTIDSDAIYTFSKDGDVVRFKAANGDIVWHKNLNKEFKFKHPRWHFSGSPLIVGDLVILNAGTSGVALNKADGSFAWQSDKGVPGYATGVPFTLDGQNCIAMMVSREVVALNPLTGDVTWRFPWKTSYDINAAEPIISGDKMFISSGYNHGCAFLKINGNKVTEIWQNKSMCNQINSSVLWEGYIYGFSGQVNGGGKLTCIDFATGQVKWSQGGMGTGSLMLADGKLIILSEDGKLVIAQASPDQYKEIASARILSGKCWTVPVLANGRIYARNAAGHLVCVDVSGKS